MFTDEILGFTEYRDQIDLSEMDIKKSGMELAQAYVPFQTFNAANLFSLEESLLKGTVFPELCRPYEPRRWDKPINKAGTWV